MSGRWTGAVRRVAVVTGVVGWCGLVGVTAAVGQPTGPKVGERAADFTLRDTKGQASTLSQAVEHGPVVVVVGRGWPGYQCPFCTRQYGEFMRNAGALRKAGASVWWIYPGPADDLAMHADAFTAGADVPANFRVLVDPGYAFTNAYGLRWDAPKETAYPATFVIDRQRIVRFANVSLEHGGRTRVADVLASLDTLR